MDDIGGLVLFWFICAFVAGIISSAKGRSFSQGFFWGLALGIFGIIVVVVLSKGQTCPYCAEIIKSDAVVCKHCGKKITEEQKEEEDDYYYGYSDDDDDGDYDDDYEDDEFFDTPSNDNGLEIVIDRINHINLKKSAEEYYKHGIVLLKKNEFNDAIIEFAKAIRQSSPKEKWYQSAKEILEEMGFSEADIRHI